MSFDVLKYFVGTRFNTWPPVWWVKMNMVMWAALTMYSRAYVDIRPELEHCMAKFWAHCLATILADGLLIWATCLCDVKNRLPLVALLPGGHAGAVVGSLGRWNSRWMGRRGGARQWWRWWCVGGGVVVARLLPRPHQLHCSEALVERVRGSSSLASLCFSWRWGVHWGTGSSPSRVVVC